MARPVPAELGEKVRRVLRAAEVARGADRRHFDFTGEVEAGVRLVLSEAGDVPLAFSLWSRPQDIAALCADASVPATAALLATDAAQAREANAAGVAVDLAQFTRSQSHPDVYYVLFDYASPDRLHAVLHRLVPALTTHADAA